MEEIDQIIDEGGSEIIEWIQSVLDYTLFNLGKTPITVSFLVFFLASIFFVFFLAERLRRLITGRLLKRYQLDPSTNQSIGTITKYVFVCLGLFIVLQSSGIDLSSLTVLAGALGVGIGFGLQNIMNNFISGIIILFERPIKIGDRIEVNGVYGDVVQINARSTEIITNDNISIIVPNSEFISSNVINWSHNERRVRFNFPVGTAYNSNPTHVKRILIEVAMQNEGVLKEPAPDVLFDEFGDNSLNFILRVWSIEYINKPAVLKSQLYYEIFKAFTAEGIEIPFPQRDIYIKSGAENLKG
ncbi:mechanosensitive ion channel family protein [Penaeicola halotolerans]|uniref:mechanosensitive ion channel family protein n=1 Tax=Penaeicola halotolerans TaxID=2793196 RepID=UPI001CF872A4|nr:mechanosensitive ion channel domain-containing protein [Penaeicola halotolerans]